MDHSTNPPADPNPRRHKEYEDPHYHDADEVEAPEENEPGLKRPVGKRKSTRRLPSMRRRFEE